MSVAHNAAAGDRPPDRLIGVAAAPPRPARRGALPAAVHSARRVRDLVGPPKRMTDHHRPHLLLPGISASARAARSHAESIAGRLFHAPAEATVGTGPATVDWPEAQSSAGPARGAARQRDPALGKAGRAPWPAQDREAAQVKHCNRGKILYRMVGRSGAGVRRVPAAGSGWGTGLSPQRT